MMRQPTLAIIACVLVVAGCAVDQEKEVARYRRIIDAPHFDIADASDHNLPLTLEEALRYANRYNETLAIEGENYLQALIDRKRAVAAFLPTIDLAPTFLRRDAGDGGDGDGGQGSDRSRLDVPVTGQMNLFRGFSDAANARSAAATIQQRRALLLNVQQSLLIDVAQTFFAVLRAQRSAEVLRNSILVQDERVRDIRARRDVGVARPLEVAQIEAQASETRVALIRAENDIHNARQVLALLTGVVVNERALIGNIGVPEDLGTAEAFEQLALRRRQDLLAAIAAIEAARHDVKAAYGQYWPSISLNVSYFLSRESAPTESDWQALLSANLPLFSAGLIEADVRESLSILRQRKLDESFTRRQILQQVRNAHYDVLASRSRLNELQTTVAAAREAFEQAEDNARVGLATNLERIVAQDQLLSAELQLAGEQFDYQIAHLNLLRVAGVLDDVLIGPTTRPAEEMR